MKYNFDEIIDRKKTSSVKWDLAADQEVLPMWVADMDFRTAPEITEAIMKKVSHGIVGYSITPPEFFDAIIDWWLRNHQFDIRKEWLLAGPGMIPTISAIVRTFVKAGENIIIQPPVYNHFYNIAQNCQFGIVENNLIYQNGNYQIDYDDLEAKASDPNTKLLLLCNPHNPVGKVWSKTELERLAEICSRNNVIVVSDEIHADLVFEGYHHIPFASIAKNYDLVSITCGSPCKTFNMSGLPISYIICDDAKILNEVQKTLQIQETDYPNSIAVEGLIAAYKHGKMWMEELKEYVHQNFLYLKNYIEKYLPSIKVIPLEATYLVWLDCSLLKKTSQELYTILLEEEKLWLNPGTMYGSAGEGFLRINIGCPRKVLAEGLQRLENGYHKIQK